MIKLIASDLDGTLLHNGAQKLTPRAIELIHELTQKAFTLLLQADASMIMSVDCFLRLRTRFPILEKMVPSVFIRER